MTAQARRGRVRARQREPRRGVVEDGTGPRGRRVTGRARRGVAGGGVRRIRGRVVARPVAARAVRRLSIEDTVAVTAGARDRTVCSSEREVRDGMVECRACPRCRAVARFTRRREAGMRRRPRCIVPRLMTGRTRRRLAGEDTVRVAPHARGCPVRSSKWEPCRVVIEARAGPRRCGVACGAGRRERGARVRGILRRLGVGLMARGALHALAAIHLVAVASRAGDGVMRSRQRKARRVMIEARVSPGADRMARRAIGEAGGLVIGHGDGSRVSRMARLAGRAASDELHLA